MEGLPEELLADILGRLPPRSLAVCRSVCNDWFTVIDARGLLLAVMHLVPHRLRGIFVNYVGQDRPYFFSREPPSPAIDAALDFMQVQQRYGSGTVLDHRNGLLLYKRFRTLYVCNPATRRWAELPTRPFPAQAWPGSEYLVFDPTVSLHYEVLFFPDVPLECLALRYDLYRLFPEWRRPLREQWEHGVANKDAVGSMAWPPALYPVQVFSSRTGEWEEKCFVREDDTTVTVSDVWSDPWGRPSDWPEEWDSVGRYHAMYWREAFYLHCLGGFIIRFSFIKETYLVIKTPRLDNLFSHPTSADSNERKKDIIPRVYLGKSQQGIYYTALYKNQLRVWVLREASGSRRVPEWELKHQAVLESSFSRHYARRRVKEKIEESWNLDRGYQKGRKDRRDYEWDSDNDSGVDVGGGEDGEEVGSVTDYWDQCANARSDLLGFHPHKEIVFFGKGFDGFAYNLSSSKLEYLGSFLPTGCRHIQVAETCESFIYTPCMYDMLPLQEEYSDDDDDDDNDDDEYDDDYYYYDNDDDDEDDDSDDDYDDDDNEEEEAEKEENNDDDLNWLTIYSD